MCNMTMSMFVSLADCLLLMLVFGEPKTHFNPAGQLRYILFYFILFFFILCTCRGRCLAVFMMFDTRAVSCNAIWDKYSERHVRKN